MRPSGRRGEGLCLRVPAYHQNLTAGAVAFGKLETNAEVLAKVSGYMRKRVRIRPHLVAEFEGAEWHIDSVASHVAKGAGAEIVPAAPIELMVNLVLETGGMGRAEPDIPSREREQDPSQRAIETLRPDGAVGPDVNFARGADDASLNDFDGAAQTRLGAALIAHCVARFFSLQGRARSGFVDV